MAFTLLDIKKELISCINAGNLLLLFIAEFLYPALLIYTELQEF